MKVLILTLLAIVLSAAIWLYCAWWQPNARLRDVDWMERQDPATLVAESRKVLRLPFGNHHDASLFVLEHGGPECVPDLITALRWLPRNGRGDDTMSCPKAHCIEALETLTGARAGVNHADWAEWWRDRQRVVQLTAPGR